MDDLALFPSPDGITITEDPNRDNGYWRVTLADGWSISFGRSIFRDAAKLRAYIRRVFVEKEGRNG
ncbi:hypothetical protein [Nocardia cyriacigeorgica]|uniref:hypothetical protein n=1 Tax=Nocardia cyriacigeorgica TaxID=135487 RepID=UPI002453B7F4|nr:hypothetical protein [Nocardia cyriacigeorgica]